MYCCVSMQVKVWLRRLRRQRYSSTSAQHTAGSRQQSWGQRACVLKAQHMAQLLAQDAAWWWCHVSTCDFQPRPPARGAGGSGMYTQCIHCVTQHAGTCWMQSSGGRCAAGAQRRRDSSHGGPWSSPAMVWTGQPGEPPRRVAHEGADRARLVRQHRRFAWQFGEQWAGGESRQPV